MSPMCRLSLAVAEGGEVGSFERKRAVEPFFVFPLAGALSVVDSTLPAVGPVLPRATSHITPPGALLLRQAAIVVNNDQARRHGPQASADANAAKIEAALEEHVQLTPFLARLAHPDDIESGNGGHAGLELDAARTPTTVSATLTPVLSRVAPVATTGGRDLVSMKPFHQQPYGPPSSEHPGRGRACRDCVYEYCPNSQRRERELPKLQSVQKEPALRLQR